MQAGKAAVPPGANHHQISILGGFQEGRGRRIILDDPAGGGHPRLLNDRQGSSLHGLRCSLGGILRYDLARGRFQQRRIPGERGLRPGCEKTDFAVPLCGFVNGPPEGVVGILGTVKPDNNHERTCTGHVSSVPLPLVSSVDSSVSAGAKVSVKVRTTRFSPLPPGGAADAF